MANTSSNSQMPDWVPRLIVTVIVAVLAIGVVVFLVMKLTSLISLLLVSLFLSFALEPLANRLVAKGWRRGAATGLILLGFVVVILVLIGAMVPLIIGQFNEAVRQAPDWVATVSELLNRWFGITVSQSDLLNQVKSADGFVASNASNFTSNIFGFSKQLLVGILQVLGVLLFTFYFVADAPRLRRLICSFVPPKSQWFVLNTWEVAIEKTGGYMLSRAFLAIISSAVSFVVLLALGVPFALPLALWLGVISQILPVIGTYLAATVPLLVALVAKPEAILPLLIFIIIYQQIENYFLAPRITAETMELHPAVAFAAVLAGGSIAGLVGALLALPLAAILQESTKEYFKRHELVDSTLLSTVPQTRQSRKPPERIKKKL